MLEQLKSFAMQKLAQKMMGNSLNSAATSEAASEGANALMESLKGGNMSQLTALFSGGADAEGGNDVINNVKSKMQEILQAKGMSAEEAETESASTAQDLVSGLKEKFQSTSEEDSAFDISNITGLLGGNAGDLLNKAKNLF
jgi:hypothetical protein